MRDRRFEAAALAAAMVLAGCATEKKKVEASSEVIYEEADGGAPSAASADPFAGCQAKQQQNATVLACGNVASALIELPRVLSPATVDQELTKFEGSFPQQSTRERFTQKFGEVEGQGSRVFENSPVQPFRSELVFVPSGSGMRALQCVIHGSVDWTRCGKIVQEMAAHGVPPRVPGAPQPPAQSSDTAAADGGTMPGSTPPPGGSVSGGSTPK